MKAILWSRTQFPTFEPNIVLGITLAFIVGAFVRGVAWMLGGPPGTVSDLMLDIDFGRERLGLLLALGSVLYLAALATGRHLAVWAAHGLLCAIHFGAGMTILESVLDYGSGVQYLVFVCLNLAWHGAVMWKMRPLPPPHIGT